MYGEYCGDDDIGGSNWNMYGGSGDGKGRGEDLFMTGIGGGGDRTEGGDLEIYGSDCDGYVGNGDIKMYRSDGDGDGGGCGDS